MRSFILSAAALLLSFPSSAQSTWIPCTLPIPTLTDLAMGPNGELATWSATNPIQIKISSDQGQVWVAHAGTGGPNGMGVSDPRLFFTPAGTILFWGGAGSSSYVWRSTNSGDSFTQLTGGNGVPGSRFFMGFAAAANGDVYLFGEGIMRSMDDGLTWADVVPSSANVMAIALNSTNLFGTDGLALYKGALDGTGYATLPTGSVSAGNYYSALATTSTDRIIAVGGDDRCITSTDNGVTWTAANTGIGATPSTLDHIATSPINDAWVAGKQISVRYTASQGDAWVVAEDGLGLASNEPIEGILCDPSGMFYLYGYSHLYRMDSSTGLKPAASASSSTMLYPDPATGSFTLERAVPAEEALVLVRDLSGKLVLQTRWEARTTRTVVDISGLPAGTYAVEVRTREGLQVKRLVKQ